LASAAAGSPPSEPSMSPESGGRIRTPMDIGGQCWPNSQAARWALPGQGTRAKWGGGGGNRAHGAQKPTNHAGPLCRLVLNQDALPGQKVQNHFFGPGYIHRVRRGLAIQTDAHN
jgi:hypothetical protein